MRALSQLLQRVSAIYWPKSGSATTTKTLPLPCVQDAQQWSHNKAEAGYRNTRRKTKFP